LKRKNTYLVFLSLFLLVGCHEPGSGQEADPTHFAYDSQEEWVHVGGEMQSPINIMQEHTITLDKAKEPGGIEISYARQASSVVNNGHTIQIAANGVAKINGRSFELTQVHFHAQSEHTVDNMTYPMEAHFVHKGQDGRLAVIGVFFELGGKSNAFDTVLHNIDNTLGAIELRVEEMLPQNKSYYHYLGSLTTPPLTENVEWYVLKTPVSIAPEQLKEFQTLYPNNSRQLQPLNRRTIVSFDADAPKAARVEQ